MIPHGVTVKGAFGDQDTHVNDATPTPVVRGVVSFPLPAPANLTDAQVNFAPGPGAADNDPTCTGSVDNPTAPAGKVCLYFASGSGTVAPAGFALGSGARSRFGFEFRKASTGTDTAFIQGTWAYKAP